MTLTRRRFRPEHTCDVNGAVTTNPSYPITTPLESEWTYYWAVDEVNGSTTWDGSVWRFKTSDYLVVDDFNSYSDVDDSAALKAVWKDRFEGDGINAYVYVEKDRIWFVMVTR